MGEKDENANECLRRADDVVMMNRSERCRDNIGGNESNTDGNEPHFVLCACRFARVELNTHSCY